MKVSVEVTIRGAVTFATIHIRGFSLNTTIERHWPLDLYRKEAKDDIAARIVSAVMRGVDDMIREQRLV